MKNMEDFLIFGVKTTKIKLKKTQMMLDTYKNLLKEYKKGTFTTGDYRAFIKDIRGSNILYPFYQEVRRKYKIYNLTIGKQ